VFFRVFKNEQGKNAPFFFEVRIKRLRFFAIITQRNFLKSPKTNAKN
jgi:hypothetical protein